MFIVKTPTGHKRVKGEVSLLTGLVAFFLQQCKIKSIKTINALLFAAHLLRVSSKNAFKRKKLSLMTKDVMSEISRLLNIFYDDKEKNHEISDEFFSL